MPLCRGGDSVAEQNAGAKLNKIRRKMNIRTVDVVGEVRDTGNQNASLYDTRG
jgi:hypothetical protein